MDKTDFRRFRYLQVIVVLAGLALAGRLVQIQVVDHSRHLDRAKKTWSDNIPLKAERGNLYDRQMRPLALSVAAWRVGVATSLLNDEEGRLDSSKVNALVADLSVVLDQNSDSLKRKIRSAKGKHIVVAPSQLMTRPEMMKLRGFKATTVEDLRARIYPYDGLAASLIGFHRHDEKEAFSTGLERSLSGYLDGNPGKAQVITTGRLGENLGQVVVEEARHGQNLVLSLDADLQDICEKQLSEAVKETGSIGGSVLVLSPDTGDVLAAASWPLMKSREGRHSDPAVWNNRNFTHQYEPGSVFKIFTTSSLLRHGAIDTAMVFDCSNSDFGKFRIQNDEGHAYGDLSLMMAFAKSSNIYFARAVGNLRSEELYRDLMDFGFGQDPGFPYPASLRGILSNPSMWSGRSKPTIAIGQEVAVTPLQLGLAVCAVANGGTLYAPRLIQEVRNERGLVLERIPPRALRKVMAKPMSDLLRDAMARVVDHGTGIGAKEKWITSGGKTGTAQKSVDGHGYTPGAYMATFTGIVPVDDPRLVVVTILDQPRGIKHYASLSAVPLFRDVVRGIRSGTSYLTDAPGASTAPMAPASPEKQVMVPDVMHLSLENASLRLSEEGLQVSGTQKGGLVVQQVPLPGSRMKPGSTVHLTTGPKTRNASSRALMCPDFSGLSNRQINSLAARLGLDVQVSGVGYAVGQSPEPGLAIGNKTVKVRMMTQW